MYEEKRDRPSTSIMQFHDQKVAVTESEDEDNRYYKKIILQYLVNLGTCVM